MSLLYSIFKDRAYNPGRWSLDMQRDGQRRCRPFGLQWSLRRTDDLQRGLDMHAPIKRERA